MADEIAIRVDHVSKNFRLPHEKTSSIKGAVVNFYRRNRNFEHQQVLNDVSFEIKKSEFFGIVGRNGSGKSTMLKMIAGIYTPTKGSVQVNGKLTPFIELGVGFNPELTGRENVFLNGALLGFNRTEMSAMYDEIVAFAELERFMDQKLKNYSSGMQVRLAFSIAIRAESDVLVLDEVLAVGDESFQRKCLDVFENYKSSRQTIVLVTHDMETVKRFCSQAVLFHGGKLIHKGDPKIVAEEYSRLNREQIDTQVDQANEQGATDLRVALKDANGKTCSRFEYGSDITVELAWPPNTKVQNAGVAIYTGIGECVYATNTFLDNVIISNNGVSCTITLDVGQGKYYIMAGTFLDKPEKKVDFVTKGPAFNVNPEQHIKGEGIARLHHYWKGGVRHG